jgi:hypothetical protein
MGEALTHISDRGLGAGDDVLRRREDVFRLRDNLLKTGDADRFFRLGNHASASCFQYTENVPLFFYRVCGNYGGAVPTGFWTDSGRRRDCRFFSPKPVSVPCFPMPISNGSPAAPLLAAVFSGY